MFSINIPVHWETRSADETINELNKLLELRSQKCIGLHVKEARDRGKQLKRGDNEYKLSDFDIQKTRYLRN